MRDEVKSLQRRANSLVYQNERLKELVADLAAKYMMCADGKYVGALSCRVNEALKLVR